MTKPVDLSKFLSTKPAKKRADLESGESEDDGFMKDFDPEDADFGGAMDQTSAASKSGRGKSSSDLPDESRAHYRGLSGVGEKKGKRMLPLPIDDVEFMGGKYAGAKVSRASLGFAPSPKEEEDRKSPTPHRLPPSTDDDEEAEAEEERGNRDESGSGLEDESAIFRAQLKAFRDAEAAQLEMVAKKATDDVERGKQVRNQLYKWQNALGIRIKMQSLLGQVQRLPSPTVWRALVESDDEIKLVKEETLESLSNITNTMLRHITQADPVDNHEVLLARYDQAQSKVWKESLDKWHQKVALTSEGTSAKRQLKVINQSLWTQVEGALRDRERLLKRAHTRRSEVSPLVTEFPAFDDGDFFSSLVRTWVDSGTDNGADVALAAGLVVKNVKHNRTELDSRGSKGRRLKFDVQDKLVNFMVPERDPLAWAEERIDAFFSSVFPEVDSVATA